MSENREALLVLNAKIDKVEDKLDTNFNKLDEKLDSIDKTLVKQHEQLSFHIQRTTLAEENLKVLKAYIDQEAEKIIEKIEPIDKHVLMVKVIGKFLIGTLGVVATLAGIYATFFNN
jgi:phage-related tail protein